MTETSREDRMIRLVKDDRRTIEDICTEDEIQELDRVIIREDLKDLFCNDN